MANTVSNQSRPIAMWHNRPVVMIQEDNGGDIRFHGLLIGPPKMTYATALVLLDEAFKSVLEIDDGAEEWGYDDVLVAMCKEGFEEILPADWWEEAV